ncbi:helix-turn-helix transcriptional regulator [Rummeliibacillus sp. POC4]|uniref:helix-turn-helix transcriptional regulator n=1 Tax=Rummeliibacillus sp. POC4 TaxID=2305899 RepID=UPI000E66F850|nr:helix-turn-helix transcriptional regulator [Rummeliibacillus sp. POC4]RIJ64150.1 XRE family transcriptional regulator [Rummeliibacillus sp. POC4]
MAMSQKIKILLVKKGMNVSQLAAIMGTSQPNLSKKMSRDNFSEKDLEEIAKALDVKYEGFFFLEDGDRI